MGPRCHPVWETFEALVMRRARGCPALRAEGKNTAPVFHLAHACTFSARQIDDERPYEIRQMAALALLGGPVTYSAPDGSFLQPFF